MIKKNDENFKNMEFTLMHSSKGFSTWNFEVSKKMEKSKKNTRTSP